MSRIIKEKTKQKILEEYQKNTNKSAIARKYNVSPSYVCKVLKDYVNG